LDTEALLRTTKCTRAPTINTSPAKSPTDSWLTPIASLKDQLTHLLIGKNILKNGIKK
jgi:hypothetical protein